MALTNFVQLADATDTSGNPVQAVWQADDDVTGEVITQYFDIGTSQTDVEIQMGDADTAENPPADPIQASEPIWQYNPETKEYCVFGADGRRLFVLKRDTNANSVFAILTDVNDGKLGVGIIDAIADIHLRRYDNAVIRSESTLPDSDAMYQVINDVVAWSFGVTGVSDNFIIAQAFDLATNIRIAITPEGNFGIGTFTPNPSAVLDLVSTTRTFIPPRMTTTQRDAIASPIAGMIIYNVTTNVLDFHNGTSWSAV